MENGEPRNLFARYSARVFRFQASSMDSDSQKQGGYTNPRINTATCLYRLSRVRYIRIWEWKL